MHFLALSAIISPLFSLLVTAHFQLQSPPARGFDEDKLDEYPCGSQNTASSNRSMFPITGGPIQLKMGHDRAEVQVNIALGNDAVDGNAFNVSLVPIFQEEGLGEFCLGDVMIPSSLGIKNGDNATIQVITNGDSQGGLYNCADVTFSTSAKPGACTNGTGVTAVAYTGSSKNANGSDSSTATTTSSTSSPSPTSGAEKSLAKAGVLGLLMGGVAVGALV